MKLDAIGARPDVSQLLEQMRNMRAAATNSTESIAAPNETPKAPLTEFGKHLADAVDGVNRLQVQSGQMTEMLVREQSKDYVGTFIAAQRANIAFQAATQVRNRLVTAYEQIMNMPI